MNSQRAASRSRLRTGNHALQPTVGQNRDTPLDQTGGIGKQGVHLKDTFI